MTSGGISTYYATLADLLAESGHEVTVLTVGHEGHDRGTSGIEVIGLDRTVTNRFEQLVRVFDPELHGALHRIAVGLAFRDWLRSNAERKGIMLLEAPEYGGAASFLLEMGLPAMVVTCHGSLGQVLQHNGRVHLQAADRLVVSLEHIALACGDEIICHTDAAREHWGSYLGRVPRLATAPLRLPADSSRVWVERDDLLGVAVGRLQLWKGPITAIESLKLCLERGMHVILHWVGRDTPTAPMGGSMKRYLEQHYPSLWGSSFVWTEDLSPHEVRSLQARADFALVPSNWDTLNYTAIEAMSVGTPLIITESAGASYLCRQGDNAIVVPPEDPLTMADAIQSLGQDIALRKKLGRKGRDTVIRVFSREKVVQERLDVYMSALQRHQYRSTKPYYTSLLNPFVLEWFRAAELATDEACLTRISGRKLVGGALRKLLRRVKPGANSPRAALGVPGE